MKVPIRPMIIGAFCSMLGLHLLLPIAVEAQTTGQITGVVTSDLGQPLAGVQVSVRGTRLSTQTSDNGRYILVNVPAGQQVVETLFIGFAAQTLPVTVVAGTPAILDIKLQTRAVALDQIVVVGYGTQRREEITGAVASVTANDFVAGPAKDAAQLIAGKIPGLAVVTPTGDPTSTTQISLRGRTTLQGPTNPLVLIDGVPGGLSTVAPQDIESITVLKDGSAAAVYGARASNGVILITTKRHDGGAPTLRYDGYINQQTIYKKPEFLSAEDYRRLITEGYNFRDFGYSTDWLSEVLREPVSHRHTFTLAGGASNTNYTASLNFENTQGIFRRSDNKEITGRMNVRHTMFDGRLEAEGNVLLRNQSNFTGTDFDWVWQMATSRNPTDRVKDDNGNWAHTSTGALRYENPVPLIEEQIGKEENRSQRMHGTITLRPFSGLRLSAMGGTSRSNGISGVATTFEHQTNAVNNSGGTAGRSSNADIDRIFEATGTYTTNLADHNISVLGGYRYQDFLNEGFSASNSRFPTDLFGYDQLQRGTGLADGIASMSSSKSNYKTAGFFGRVNYDWRNRYLLMASLAYEANSRFGAGNKWGVFPGVQLGWKISEESFMDALPFIDDLKLRGGYGVTGIAPNSSYLSLTSYGYGSRILYGTTWVQGLAPNRNPNPNLRWEEKEEINVGLNLSAFNYRLTGSLDVYRRDTRDMLYDYSVPVPPNLFNSILANVGHMRNNGIEIELGYNVFDRPNLRWTTSANWSRNTNKLVSLSNDVYNTADCFTTGGTGAPIQQSTHRVCIGQPIGNFYGFKSIDIDNNGEWIIERPAKLDSLGNILEAAKPIPIRSITEADRQILGNGIPKQYFAWNNSAQIGNFDVNVNMRGALDYQVLNYMRMNWENPSQLAYNMLKSAFEPAYGKTLVKYDLAYVSYYLEDGDYLKLDNATIGYTFREGSLGRLSNLVNNARLYVSGRNLLTITGYKGMDPEVSISGLSPGIDSRAQYPTTRLFTVGMTVGF